MTDIDKEITDAFSLLGVLLVFVFAYASALAPLVFSALERDTPGPIDDRAVFIGRLRAYRWLVRGVFVAAGAVLGLLFPLSYRVLRDLSLSGAFHTVRAGLVMVDTFLLLSLVAASFASSNLSARIKKP